jgi:hypothetical protein
MTIMLILQVNKSVKRGVQKQHDTSVKHRYNPYEQNQGREFREFRESKRTNSSGNAP